MIDQQELRDFLLPQMWSLFASNKPIKVASYISFFRDKHGELFNFYEPYFKELIKPFMALEKNRPKHIPEQFYNKTAWVISVAREHADKLDLTLEANRIIKNEVEDKILFLSNLISSDPALKDFYKLCGRKDDLLMSVSGMFETLAEWQYSFRTTAKKDTEVIKQLKEHLLICSDLLIDSVDVRLNLQVEWLKHMRKINKDLGLDKYPDFRGLLIQLAEYLEDIKPVAASKKHPYVKHLHAEDAIIHYAVRRLKELFKKGKVHERKHVKLISDLINVVIKEKIGDGGVSDERIRKLIA